MVEDAHLDLVWEFEEWVSGFARASGFGRAFGSRLFFVAMVESELIFGGR